jgi:hypothetical protein
VRRNTHIHVEFLYHYLPAGVSRTMSVLVDVVRVAFLAYATYLGIVLVPKMQNLKMTVIDFPMSYIYGFVAFGFAMMTFRAVQVTIQHWKQGWSVLDTRCGLASRGDARRSTRRTTGAHDPRRGLDLLGPDARAARPANRAANPNASVGADRADDDRTPAAAALRSSGDLPRATGRARAAADVRGVEHHRDIRRGIGIRRRPPRVATARR